MNVWDYLLSCCSKEEGLVLLKINLINIDSPVIFDYIHIRKMTKDLTWEGFIFNTEAHRKRIAEGNRDYWNSRIEFNRYEGNFVLPEIVTSSPIPIERVEFLGKR